MRKEFTGGTFLEVSAVFIEKCYNKFLYMKNDIYIIMIHVERMREKGKLSQINSVINRKYFINNLYEKLR